MLLIVLLHTTYASFGYPDTLNQTNILILIFSSLSIYAVDVFILISGYFGVKPKKKSIVNLLFICFFACICRIIVDLFFGNFSLSKLLFISRSNWFIISYLGLLIVSPILNTYIELASKKQFAILISGFFCYTIYFSIFPRQADIEPGFNNGCSLIWFIEVYLIGRYLKLYGLPVILRKYSAILLALSIIVIFLGQIAFVKLGYINRLAWWGAQNQPLVLLAALSLFAQFFRINITSNCVNWIAQSTLMVLLIHSPVLTKNYFNFISTKYSDNLLFVALLWIVGVCLIYCICTIVDQIRLIIYKKLIETHL